MKELMIGVCLMAALALSIKAMIGEKEFEEVNITRSYIFLAATFIILSND